MKSNKGIRGRLVREGEDERKRMKMERKHFELYEENHVMRQMIQGREEKRMRRKMEEEEKEKNKKTSEVVEKRKERSKKTRGETL